MTQSKKGGEPVGERLHIDKAGKGGFASVEFAAEEKDGKAHFRGA